MLGGFTGFSFVDEVSDVVKGLGGSVIGEDELLFGMHFLFEGGEGVSCFRGVSIS